MVVHYFENEIPNLIPHTLDTGRISYSCKLYVLYANHIKIPLITFNGLCKDKQDARFIKWRCKTILEIVGITGGLICDFSQTVFDNLLALKYILTDYENRKIPVSVILHSDIYSLQAQNYKSIDNINFSDKIDAAFYLLQNKLLSYGRVKKPYDKISIDFLEKKAEVVSLKTSDIVCKCYRWRIDKGIIGGYIYFDGKYGYGSGGDLDGIFILTNIEEFYDDLVPQALIVDLRNLIYTWGDSLNVYPINLLPDNSLIKVVVKDEQVDSFKGIVNTKHLSTSLSMSFKELSEKAAKIDFK